MALKEYYKLETEYYSDQWTGKMSSLRLYQFTYKSNKTDFFSTSGSTDGPVWCAEILDHIVTSTEHSLEILECKT